MLPFATSSYLLLPHATSCYLVLPPATPCYPPGLVPVSAPPRASQGTTVRSVTPRTTTLVTLSTLGRAEDVVVICHHCPLILFPDMCHRLLTSGSVKIIDTGNSGHKSSLIVKKFHLFQCTIETTTNVLQNVNIIQPHNTLIVSLWSETPTLSPQVPSHMVKVVRLPIPFPPLLQEH